MYIHRLLNYQSFQKLLVYIATKRDNCHISNGEECFYLYTFQDTNKSKKTFLTIYYPNVKNDCIDKFNLSTIQ